MGYFWVIVTLVIALGLAWRYLGAYMVGVFEGRIHFLSFVERPIYRLLGTSPDREQSWKRYAGSLVVFSGLSIAITYAILRFQGSLPLNPQHFGAVPPALSWNTAASFVTNTNWQNYGGEDDDVVPLPDVRADGAAVRDAGGRHRSGAGHRPRVLQEGIVHRRQLLGRHHPGHALRARCRSPSWPASSSSARARSTPCPARPPSTTRSTASPRPSPWDRWASWRRSNSSAPTVAASSTSTRPTPSRTPPR